MRQLIQDLQGLGFDSATALNPFDPTDISTYDEYFYLCDAQRWLREEKGIHIEPYWEDVEEEEEHYCVGVYLARGYDCEPNEEHKTYKEALQKGIEIAIKILKDGSN